MPSVPSHSHPRDAYNSRSRAFFRQFVAPEFQTSGYRHRFATPDPPKAVARIRYQLLKRPPFGVAARLPWVAMREPLSGLFIGFETKALRIGV